MANSLRVASAILLAVSVMLVSSGAYAQSGTELDQRLDFLVERLDASKRHGMLWQWGWMAVSAGGLAATVALALDNDDHHKERTGNIVEASKSAIGVTYLTLLPMQARHGANAIRAMPGGTVSEREAQVREAEKLLEANAKRAKEPTDWKMYAGNVALQGIGLGITLGWGRSRDAWINFAAGMAAGTLQIWSEPSRPLSDWKEYQQRFGGATVSRSEWWISPNQHMNGLAINYRW